MTQTARLYGSSLYELAAEEQLTDVLMEQMEEVRQLFRENPEYVKLLGEPSIPGEKREELLEQAFGGQAQRYLVNFEFFSGKFAAYRLSGLCGQT